ncbi:MAG TPA: SgcJ/EcaC family oxidoreductase [Aquihabitans sp.]|nr:SgcJ/EcaC family oxidoreductase [Aquihabitans sp.]
MEPRTTQRPTLADPADGTDHAEDRRRIADIVRDVETGFNTKDADLAVEHFAADAVAINAVGGLVSGWDELAEAHRVGFAGFLAEQFARYEVGPITFVRPDVAIVLKEAWATDRSGADLDLDHAMRALYVFVKEDGRWWIAARGNTLVAR